jgi:hypothetical protein
MWACRRWRSSAACCSLGAGERQLICRRPCNIRRFCDAVAVEVAICARTSSLRRGTRRHETRRRLCFCCYCPEFAVSDHGLSHTDVRPSRRRVGIPTFATEGGEVWPMNDQTQPLRSARREGRMMKRACSSVTIATSHGCAPRERSRFDPHERRKVFKDMR